jgi:hypothetical protein
MATFATISSADAEFSSHFRRIFSPLIADIFRPFSLRLDSLFGCRH